jgi:hypothetical protein
MRNEEVAMISLVGEQPAPNLLPAYELKPKQILLVATKETTSVAERLMGILNEKGYQTDIVVGLPYNVEETEAQIQEWITGIRSEGSTKLVGNFTGGTKLMVLALLKVMRTPLFEKKQLCYFRTERSQGILYFYDPKTFVLLEERKLQSTLSLEDYLKVYLGEYSFKRMSKGDDKDFEEAVASVLKPVVDELEMGLKKGGALEIDLIFRCGNQIGIAEVKTGGKARKKEGIDQLNTAGGRDFLGTYVKKFLIVDTLWNELTNLRELAQARNIILIELPSFGAKGKLDLEDQDKLVTKIRSVLFCEGV